MSDKKTPTHDIVKSYRFSQKSGMVRKGTKKALSGEELEFALENGCAKKIQPSKIVLSK